MASHNATHWRKTSYSAKEIGQLMDSQLARCEPAGYRNAALLALGWGAGLRLKEALSVMPGDLTLDGRPSIWIRDPKGKVEPAEVGLDPSAAHYVRLWADLRVNKIDTKALPDAPLICRFDGGRISQSQVRVTLFRIRQELGWSKRLHYHGLRHTHAALMYENGTGIAEIQEQLRHVSARTTETYLKSVGRHRGADFVARGGLNIRISKLADNSSGG